MTDLAKAEGSYEIRHIDFYLVQFKEKGKQTVKQKFQVNSLNYEKKLSYDMIIGSNLLWNIGMKINFCKEQLDCVGGQDPTQD